MSYLQEVLFKSYIVYKSKSKVTITGNELEKFILNLREGETYPSNDLFSCSMLININHDEIL